MSSDAASPSPVPSAAPAAAGKADIPADPVPEAGSVVPDAAVLVARKPAKKAKKAAPPAADHAIVPVQAKKTSLQRGIAFAIQIASLESVFVMMQFLFSTVIVRSFVLLLLSPLFSYLLPASVDSSDVFAPIDAAAAAAADVVPKLANAPPIARALAQLSGSFLSVVIVLVLMVRTRPIARVPRAVDAAAASVWDYERAIVTGARPLPPQPSFLAKLAAAGHPHAPTEPLSRVAPPSYAVLRGKGAEETVGRGGGSWEWRVFVFLHKLGLLPLPDPAVAAAAASDKGKSKGKGGVCSSYVVTVVLLHLASTLVMLALQMKTGVWLYSTANFYLSDAPSTNTAAATDSDASSAAAGLFSLFSLDISRIDWGRLCDLWLIAPLCEEVVFRGVVMAHFFFKLHGAYAAAEDEDAAAAEEEEAETDAAAEELTKIAQATAAAYAPAPATTTTASAVEEAATSALTAAAAAGIGSSTGSGTGSGSISASGSGAGAGADTGSRTVSKSSPAVLQRQRRRRARALSRQTRREARLRVAAAASAAAFFAALHLVNLFSARYSKPYVLLQVLMGGLVGLGYSLRLFAGQARLWECVVLHVVNNVFSTPVDPKMGSVDTDPAASASAPAEGSSSSSSSSGGAWAWAQVQVGGVPLLVWVAVVESVIVYALLAVRGIKKELARADQAADAIEAAAAAAGSGPSSEEEDKEAEAEAEEAEAEGVFGGWEVVTRLTPPAAPDARVAKKGGAAGKKKKAGNSTKEE